MGELQLEMCYYNEKLAVWEPLLEPVMDTEDNYRPWEILIKVRCSWIHDGLVLGSFLCNFYEKFSVYLGRFGFVGRKE